MQKYTTVIFISILLITIATLFPPFSWGEEKLRTLSERRNLGYSLMHNLPIKQYDFIFNPVTKSFKIKGKYKVLERRLIVSELILEYILAVGIAIISFIVYQRFKFKTFSGLICLLGCFLILIVWGMTSDYILNIFNTSYDSVLQKEKEIKEKYSKIINGTNVYDFLRMFRNADLFGDKSYLDYDIWSQIKYNLKVPEENLPDYHDFLRDKKELVPRDIANRTKKQDLLMGKKKTSGDLRKQAERVIKLYNTEWKEKDVDVELLLYPDKEDEFIRIVKMYYPDFEKPKNKVMNYGDFFESVDRIKLSLFMQKIRPDFDYFQIRENYFNDLSSFKEIKGTIIYYGYFGLFLLLVTLVWIKRKLFIIDFSHWLEKKLLITNKNF